MPNPNAHDQPVEGGTEQIEHTLQKQSEAPPNSPKKPQDKTPNGSQKDNK